MLASSFSAASATVYGRSGFILLICDSVSVKRLKAATNLVGAIIPALTRRNPFRNLLSPKNGAAVQKMKKLGRPPKDDAAKKGIQFSIRMHSALRDLLEQARHQDGERSLTQEIELRLRQSFELEDQIKERFGGGSTYWVLQLAADTIRNIEIRTGRKWIRDPYAFEQVVAAITTIFEHFKPKGRAIVPKKLPPRPPAKTLGRHLALINLLGVEAANPARDPEKRIAAKYYGAAMPLQRHFKKSPLEALRKTLQEWEKMGLSSGVVEDESK
jgi:hypothetical protein